MITHLELFNDIFIGITCHVATSLRTRNSVDVCCIASKVVLEVTGPRDFVKHEGIARCSSWARVLTMPGWGTSKVIDDVVAASVSEIVKAVIWNWFF